MYLNTRTKNPVILARGIGRLKYERKEAVLLLMITYEPFFKTLKEKRITTYCLINTYGFSKGTLDSLRQGRNITIHTLDYLCQLLDCRPEDIIRYTPDDTKHFQEQY